MLSPTSWGADLGKGLGAFQKGDYATALREWTPLAEQGDAGMQYFVGMMYQEGVFGVLQDHKAAVKWYTLSARQGYANAQYNLGWMYYKGQGVIKDYVYSHMWHNIASSNGREKAGEYRDSLAKKLTPQQLERAQQLARECVAKDYKGC